MTPTTEQLKDLLDRSSDGPWRVSYERGTTQIRTAQNESIMCDETYYPWVPEHESDWDIIALSPTLAEEVVRLRDALTRIDRLTEEAPFDFALIRLIARQALDATSEK